MVGAVGAVGGIVGKFFAPSNPNPLASDSEFYYDKAKGCWVCSDGSNADAGTGPAPPPMGRASPVVSRFPTQEGVASPLANRYVDTFRN